jgi:hypothetical protein
MSVNLSLAKAQSRKENQEKGISEVYKEKP